MLKLGIALLVASVLPCFAQDCAGQAARFDAFLRKYNPFGNGAKATLATVKAELGQPSSMESKDGFLYAKYDFAACVGSATIDKEGYLLGTNLVHKTPLSLPTLSSTRIAEVDRQIGELKAKIDALKEVRQALLEIDGSRTATTNGASTPSAILQGKNKAVDLSVVTAELPSSFNAIDNASTSPSRVGTRVDGYLDRESTTKGQTIFTGPRGGRYHYSSSGKKVYERKK